MDFIALIKTYFNSVPVPVFIVPPILIGIGLFLVLMPKSAQLLFPLGLQGTSRRAFSWFFLIFSTVASALIFYFSIADMHGH